MQIIVDPNDDIIESDETNNELSSPLSLTIKETRSLNLIVIKVECDGQLSSAYRNNAQRGIEFAQAQFPFSPSKLNAVIRDESLPSLKCPVIPDNASLAQREEALNRLRGEIWSFGWRLDQRAQKVIGYIDDSYWNRLGLTDSAAGLARCFDNVIVIVDNENIQEHVFGVLAHELGHTLRLSHPGYPGDNCLRPGAPQIPGVDGYWVVQGPEGNRTSPLSLMAGFDSPGKWIAPQDYETVFKDSRVGMDPESLLIGGILHRDGVVEWLPVYYLPEGILTESIPGDYTLSFLNGNHQVIHEIDFEPQFYEPDAANQNASFSMFGFVIPFLPDAQFVSLTVGDKLISQKNISNTLLKDAIKTLPDEAFTKNPEQRRNALLNKVDAIATLDHPCNPQKLENDVRKHIDAWVIDYERDHVLQVSKAELLEIIDRLLSPEGPCHQ